MEPIVWIVGGGAALWALLGPKGTQTPEAKPAQEAAPQETTEYADVEPEDQGLGPASPYVAPPGIAPLPPFPSAAPSSAGPVVATKPDKVKAARVAREATRDAARAAKEAAKTAKISPGKARQEVKRAAREIAIKARRAARERVA